MLSKTRPAATMTMPRPVGDAVMSYLLSAAEASQAFALARSCMSEYGSPENVRFVSEASIIAHDLPRPLRLAMNRARLDDRLHALKIRGNVTADGDLGDTPLHWQDADTQGSRAHAFLLMLYSACLGDVIAWAAQQDGRLVTDVVPTPGMEETLVSASSHRELGWHTEDAFSPYRADYVGLLCLRNPDSVPTTVAFPDLSVIPADVVAVLMQPRFQVFADASHQTATVNNDLVGAERGAKIPDGRGPPPVPLLTGSVDAAEVRVDRDYACAVPGDDDAARALRSLVEHVDDAARDLPLAPGDTCFLDNRNVVHGRRSFLPRYDGNDRWLKRVNVVVDLRRTRPGRAGPDVRVIG